MQEILTIIWVNLQYFLISFLSYAWGIPKQPSVLVSFSGNLAFLTGWHWSKGAISSSMHFIYGRNLSHSFTLPSSYGYHFSIDFILSISVFALLYPPLCLYCSNFFVPGWDCWNRLLPWPPPLAGPPLPAVTRALP